MAIRQRTETIRFIGSRPNDEEISKRATSYLSEWTVKRIGSLNPGRTRRGSTVFDVRVTYVRNPA
jgi:hypothetical protein